MTSLEEYDEFVTVCQEAIATEDTVTMKWIGLEDTKHTIYREMSHLAYYTERVKTHPDCISLLEMYRLSIINNLNIIKRTVQELRNQTV